MAVLYAISGGYQVYVVANQNINIYIYVLLMLSNSLKMIEIHQNMSEFCQIVYKIISGWFYCMNCLLVYIHE